MVRTGESWMRSRRRNAARAVMCRRELLAPGLAGVRGKAVSRGALRPLRDTPESSALQRTSGVNMARFGSLGDPDRPSIEAPGGQLRGLSSVA